MVTAVVGQRLDFLFQLLGVESVMHVGPGVTMKSSMDTGPRMLRQSWMSVVLDMRLGWHVLHFLKHVTRLYMVFTKI